MRRLWLCCCATAGMLVAEVSAQTPTVPEAVGKPCGLAALTGGATPAAGLTASYQSGDWAKFEKVVLEIRDQINADVACMRPAAGAPKTRIEAADYLLVAWVGDPGLGDTALMTAVVHAEASEGYVSRLPGLSGDSRAKVYQIFVSDAQDDVMAAVYLSTREQNPLLKQIPDVAAEILDPMLALMSANMGQESLLKARSGTEVKGFVAPSLVRLPYERAAVKVEMRARLMSAARLVNASEKLRNTLTLIDVRYSEPAKVLACQFHWVLQKNADKCVTDGSSFSCLARVEPEFVSWYNAACNNCSGDLEKALQTVDGKYRAFVAAGVAQKLDAKAELRNVPLTRFSFGVMTGFSFLRSSSAPRVEVDDGVLEHDPLERTLTMVTFNGALRAYDADAFSMTQAERHRWFVGAAITPSFGVGLGYSFLPVRGLGINVGYAVLGISVADGGKQIGEAPVDGADPFKLGVTGTAFLGVSYNFK